MVDVALSTYALTLYNLLQLAGGTANLATLHLHAREHAHPELEEITAEHALTAMVERKYIVVNERGEYASRDRMLRLVTTRDRTFDGWNGWSNARSGFKLSEVIA